MNTHPKINVNGQARVLWNPGCGREAMANVVSSFWQSRSNLRDPVAVVDIPALARKIRKGRVS